MSWKDGQAISPMGRREMAAIGEKHKLQERELTHTGNGDQHLKCCN